MPIYEYNCTACNHAFELIQKVSDEPITHCEVCGKDTAIRLVSAAGFQLKGTGWYVTDFKNKPTTPVERTEKKTEAPEPVSVSATSKGGTD